MKCRICQEKLVIFISYFFIKINITRININQKLLFDVATATVNTATDIKERRRGKFLAHSDKEGLREQ